MPNLFDAEQSPQFVDYIVRCDAGRLMDVDEAKWFFLFSHFSNFAFVLNFTTRNLAEQICHLRTAF